MPAGRPTDYRPEYCEQVVELAKNGRGLAEIAAELGFVRSTLYLWTKEHEEFSIAIERAKEVSLAWWEAQGRKGIWGGKDFNAQAYSLQVRNRFPEDWRDKQEVEHSGSIELADRLKAARERVNGEK